MSGSRVTLRRAEADELDYVERLLATEELPTDDLRSTPTRFYIGSRAAGPVGVGGLEQYGQDALLRSVVVEPSMRGRGLGTALCEALEAAAAAEGVRTLYLLTTTAAGFFAARGYAEVDRDAAPPTIQHTTEFTDYCPASATCMTKSL